MNHSPELIAQRTRSAYIWSRLLGVPFWGMIYLLAVILYKDMHISSLQISCIITLKPMSALFAPYWSQIIYQRPDKIISNLVWANILRYLPFLFVPWIDSSWIIIAAFGLYMMFYRGVMPAWMETIKTNLPTLSRERVIAIGTTIDYCGTALLPIILGPVLDKYEQSWRWLFLGASVLGLISTVFLSRILISTTARQYSPTHFSVWDFFKGRILKPWKESWRLVKNDVSFLKFQIGFMLGGAGLMIMQPVLPMFYVDILKLSYTKMLIALTVCKGLGFAIASPLCVKLFRKLNIFQFSGLVTMLATLFPFFMLGAQLHISLLYVAYALYGIMQAGSDLSWHMSGPVFSKEKESTLFSGTNVLTVGIRGCFVPLIGTLLYALTNSATVMLLGAFLCLFATIHFMKYRFINNTETSST